MDEGYSEETLDHYESPRNSRLIENPDAEATRMNPVCGDVLRLMLRIEGNVVADAAFAVDGCVAATAAGSWLTDAIQGMTSAEAGAMDAEAINEGLGGLPPARMHGALLALDALRAALPRGS
ncbi:MAG: iron-sulfur cluster assembly scaffold protein [Dehalococcoidia bacterium]|nr:iron-sulfur cluster assembly scaffold protein [Dehalococcoidia bacterium]